LIKRTTYGCNTWIDSDYVLDYVNSICFTDSLTGWISMFGAQCTGIRKTTDGGDTWFTQIYNRLRSVHFIDNNIGWVIGWGSILKTTNGGTDWIEQYQSPAYSLRSVHFTNGAIGCAVGRGGLITVSSDGGENWKDKTTTITYNDLESTHFVDINTGWAVGTEGTIIKTTNAGEDWITQNSGTNEYFDDVCFVNNEIGWVVSDANYNFEDGKILKTSNGGDAWISQSDTGAMSVCFINSDIGWVVGRQFIRKTTDGGELWETQLDWQDERFENVYFVDENYGWVVIGNNPILRTTNGGTDWIFSASGLLGGKEVFFVDSMTGWFAHNGIAKTTDGGVTFDEQWSPPAGGGLMSVYFTDILKGWAVGRYGDIIHTTNGGNSWLSQNITSNHLFSVYFVNSDKGWIVGSDGTILYTTNGGVSFVKEEEFGAIPTAFLLSQNYPNPFNSSSVIKYSIPKSSQVVIKIFDILGNEIETLVNEEKPTGTYGITWYAEGLPSGIYFYQLKACNYLETKKMMLIK
jgi:photosystem II stability/assembly factor-like uncharacterized protein